jgi:hypothetical protein
MTSTYLAALAWLAAQTATAQDPCSGLEAELRAPLYMLSSRSTSAPLNVDADLLAARWPTAACQARVHEAFGLVALQLGARGYPLLVRPREPDEPYPNFHPDLLDFAVDELTKGLKAQPSGSIARALALAQTHRLATRLSDSRQAEVVGAAWTTALWHTRREYNFETAPHFELRLAVNGALRVSLELLGSDLNHDRAARASLLTTARLAIDALAPPEERWRASLLPNANAAGDAPLPTAVGEPTTEDQRTRDEMLLWRASIFALVLDDTVANRELALLTAAQILAWESLQPNASTANLPPELKDQPGQAYQVQALTPSYETLGPELRRVYLRAHGLRGANPEPTAVLRNRRVVADLVMANAVLGGLASAGPLGSAGRWTIAMDALRYSAQAWTGAAEVAGKIEYGSGDLEATTESALTTAYLELDKGPPEAKAGRASELLPYLFKIPTVSTWRAELLLYVSKHHPGTSEQRQALQATRAAGRDLVATHPEFLTRLIAGSFFFLHAGRRLDQEHPGDHIPLAELAPDADERWLDARWSDVESAPGLGAPDAVTGQLPAHGAAPTPVADRLLSERIGSVGCEYLKRLKDHIADYPFRLASTKQRIGTAVVDTVHPPTLCDDPFEPVPMWSQTRWTTFENPDPQQLLRAYATWIDIVRTLPFEEPLDPARLGARHAVRLATDGLANSARRVLQSDAVAPVTGLGPTLYLAAAALAQVESPTSARDIEALATKLTSLTDCKVETHERTLPCASLHDLPGGAFSPVRVTLHAPTPPDQVDLRLPDLPREHPHHRRTVALESWLAQEAAAQILAGVETFTILLPETTIAQLQVDGVMCAITPDNRHHGLTMRLPHLGCERNRPHQPVSETP